MSEQNQDNMNQEGFNQEEPEQQRRDADRPGSTGEGAETGQPYSGAPGEPSPTERMAGSAREQAGAAASALRRGEFMQDAAVDAEASNDDRLIALLCYATQMLIPFIMPAVVLLSESSKKRPFQRFHAVQSIGLAGAIVVLGIMLGIGTAFVSLIPLLGWIVALAVSCLSPILVLMAWLALAYYGYQAYQGKRFAIPGLTSFLQNQGWL